MSSPLVSSFERSKYMKTKTLREYFTLNLAQALARADALKIRRPEREVSVTVTGIRPTTDYEMAAFFLVFDWIGENTTHVTETVMWVRTSNQRLVPHSGSTAYQSLKRGRKVSDEKE